MLETRSQAASLDSDPLAAQILLAVKEVHEKLNTKMGVPTHSVAQAIKQAAVAGLLHGKLLRKVRRLIQAGNVVRHSTPSAIARVLHQLEAALNAPAVGSAMNGVSQTYSYYGPATTLPLKQADDAPDEASLSATPSSGAEPSASFGGDVVVAPQPLPSGSEDESAASASGASAPDTTVAFAMDDDMLDVPVFHIGSEDLLTTVERQAMQIEDLAAFRSLGGELADTSDKVQELETMLADSRFELAQTSDKIQELETMLAQRVDELAQTTDKIHELETMLAQRDDEAAQACAKLREFGGLLDVRDKDLTQMAIKNQELQQLAQQQLAHREVIDKKFEQQMRLHQALIDKLKKHKG